MPQRIQLRRTKGWRKPDGAIVVARPTRWGNPWLAVQVGSIYHERYHPGMVDPSAWVVIRKDRRGYRTGEMWGGFSDKAEATEFAILMFRRMVEGVHLNIDGRVSLDHWLGKLRGKDLACWCKPDQPCHADVLLDIANRPDYIHGE